MADLIRLLSNQGATLSFCNTLKHILYLKTNVKITQRIPDHGFGCV